jgi:SAM-dependent methyltransferase
MKEIYNTIQCCRICSSNELKDLLHLGNQAPANSLYGTSDNAPIDVPLRLVYCNNCSTVQLGEDVDPNYLFSQYLWVTGTSNTAENYSFEFAKKALEKIENQSNNKPYVVEVASNDGTFLKRFIESNCKVLGIDPAKNIAELANKNGIPTSPNFFNIDIARELIKKDGQADIIFARNVIPHVKEIHSVIEGISAFLKDDGVGIIEFHNAGLVLDELHYDYIYHEHLFYFTLKTMNGLIHRYGLNIYDLMYSPISGGSWVVYFSKKKKTKSKKLIEIEKQEIQNELNSYSRWTEFSENVLVHSEKLKKIVFNSSEKIPAYGASARSSTLLNFCGINSENISVVIDKNPLKVGLYTAGSNIPIVSFQDGLEEIKKAGQILLLAWNFQDEIIKDLRSAGFKGQFIIPLPGDPYIL